MNFSKKTLFWIIVLIMLSGTFYFFDKKEEANKQIAEENLKLLPFNEQDVSEFWIDDTKKNTQIRFVRAEDGWQLVQPLSAKGANKTIKEFLTNIITARKDAMLFSQAEDVKLGELGLVSPELEMGMKVGGVDTVLLFGGQGPTLNVSYIMFKGKPEVYRVHSDLKKQASIDTYTFRDKTILDFDPVKLRRLEILQKGAKRVIIEQDRGKWNMLEPTRGKASMKKVLESLYAIKNGEIKAFIDENPSDLAPYGLVTPMLHLTIYQEEIEQPYVLTIGSKDRANRGYFATSNLAQKVFDVEEDLVNSILLNMDQLLEVDAGV